MVEPKQDWGPCVDLAAAKPGPSSTATDYRKLLIYDACGRCDRPTLAGRGFKRLPLFDPGHFEAAASSVLMEDENGKSLIGENDILGIQRRQKV